MARPVDATAWTGEDAPDPWYRSARGWWAAALGVALVVGTVLTDLGLVWFMAAYVVVVATSWSDGGRTSRVVRALLSGVVVLVVAMLPVLTGASELPLATRVTHILAGAALGAVPAAAVAVVRRLRAAR